MVLSMGVLVVAAILPLVPTYINSYLQRLFRIFCDLATIRTTKRLGESVLWIMHGGWVEV